MRILICLVLLAFVGCSDTSDSQVSGGNFTVYFENPKDFDLAKDIVEFWKKDSLMTGKKQDVRLTRSSNGYDLLLIAEKKKKAADLTFEEIKSLSTLEERLMTRVFRGEDVSIVIADENFKPLFQPTR